MWGIKTEPNAISLAILHAGDYDRNGTVDAANYLDWKQAYGTNATSAHGNGDGLVDDTDYSVWRNNLGAGLGSARGKGGLANTNATIP